MSDKQQNLGALRSQGQKEGGLDYLRLENSPT